MYNNYCPKCSSVILALNKFGIRFRCLVRLQIQEILFHSHNKITGCICNFC
ncbi:unnamed protein product [Meloidogyne enterolobii]|uniref:Uncharacterized protein n=1 Tax=Meloidogyne enterolobii TaxID=390850 RepID=A0ACB1ASD1_MELEN